MLRRLTPLALILTGLLWAPSPAIAQFNVGLGMGTNVCIPNGDADCSNLLPLGHLSALMEYRFGGLVGWSLEYDYGAYWPTGTGADRLTQRSTHFLTTIRGYYDYRDWDVYSGLGLGFASHRLTDTVADEELASFSTLWAAFKVSLGATRPWDLADGLHWGIRADQIYYLSGEACVVLGGAQNCEAIDDTNVAGQLQISWDVRYVF